MSLASFVLVIAATAARSAHRYSRRLLHQQRSSRAIAQRRGIIKALECEYVRLTGAQ